MLQLKEQDTVSLWVPHRYAQEEEGSGCRGKIGVEEIELLSQRAGVISFLYLSLFFLSIFPSLPQAKEIGEKGNAVSSRVPGFI